jgi:apolipoprotein D and lipocalin family protein
MYYYIKNSYLYIIMYKLLLVASLFASCFAVEPSTVDSLDIPKYVGTWYQVYQDKFNNLFQKPGSCSTADYSIIDETKISVHNQQYDTNGNIDAIDGYAYYKDGDCCGKLTVKLEDNPEAPYWVLALGPVINGLYEYSIISDDKKLSLFVITRDVDRFYNKYDDEVLKQLDSLGFTKPYNAPIPSNQTDC